MNEREFKKHLAALAHGHHHIEEHDWGLDPSVAGAAASREPAPKKAVKRPAAKAKKK